MADVRESSFGTRWASDEEEDCEAGDEGVLGSSSVKLEAEAGSGAEGTTTGDDAASAAGAGESSRAGAATSGSAGAVGAAAVRGEGEDGRWMRPGGLAGRGTAGLGCRSGGA